MGPCHGTACYVRVDRSSSVGFIGVKSSKLKRYVAVVVVVVVTAPVQRAKSINCCYNT